MSNYNSNDGDKLSPNSNRTRNVLRLLGVVFAGIAVFCYINAFSLDPFDSMVPVYMISAILCTFFGFVFLGFGFGGSITRYQAAQMAPIAKDTTNYMLDGTKDNIVDIASSIIGSGSNKGMVVCGSCKHKNDKEAKFCDNCGKPLYIECKKCGAPNDSNAKFCKKCGARLR